MEKIILTDRLTYPWTYPESAQTDGRSGQERVSLRTIQKIQSKGSSPIRWTGNCYDRRREIYEGSHPAGKEGMEALEVPIGCVIVHGGEIIARGYNRRNTDKNTLSHAELNAIRRRAGMWGTGGWRSVPCMSRWNPVRCARCHRPGQDS